MITCVSVAIVVLAIYLLGPFPLWRSYLLVFRSVLQSRELSPRSKLSLFAYQAKDLLYFPLLTALWLIDEALWRGYRRTEIAGPLFIMSQPRSGTTFLLRTLAEDQESFFTLKHLDWRVPSIGFWKVIDLLGLRKRIEQINYWPDTELGRLASKMHFHNMGTIEGHGVFFEERMYHHYFTFRRFPLPTVLKRVSGTATLSEREKKRLVSTLKKVVQKAAYYHGNNRIWLTKENENVDLYRLVHEAFPKARFLVIARQPKAFVRSYISASNTSTRAKHGIDPHSVPNWYAANLAFRQNECRKQIAFCRELDAKNIVSYVSYEQFTADIVGTIGKLYDEIGIPLGNNYAEYLNQLQIRQNARDPGYANDANTDVTGFEEYSSFTARVAQTIQSAGRAGDEFAV